MRQRKKRVKAVVKRFSISLDTRTYNRLHALAKRRQPPLSLQYVVQFAVQRLLDGTKDPQLESALAFPRPAKGH